MRLLKTILFGILFLFISGSCSAREFAHILNDNCIDSLYYKALNYFENNNNFEIEKDPRGILIRFKLSNSCKEVNYIENTTYQNILSAEDFLAKIKNPVIIEVHTKEASCTGKGNLKNWEISTLIANNIESIVLTPRGKLARDRVSSIGYGEFLPPKNTPNNGSKYKNRVDIIILCNVSGE